MGKNCNHSLGKIDCPTTIRYTAISICIHKNGRLKLLIPPRIVWLDPVDLNTADSPGCCRCDDNFEYALKDTRHHRLTPHAEWFCTHLAGLVGIGCPPCAIIDDTKGNLLFGSRWEGGIARDKWWDMTSRGDIDLQIIAPQLSRILAFDFFVYNDDRHLNNYLVRESRNVWVMLAFDWSRAWTFHGFPPNNLPFSPNQKTILAHRHLKKMLGNFTDKKIHR